LLSGIANCLCKLLTRKQLARLLEFVHRNQSVRVEIHHPEYRLEIFSIAVHRVGDFLASICANFLCDDNKSLYRMSSTTSKATHNIIGLNQLQRICVQHFVGIIDYRQLVAQQSPW